MEQEQPATHDAVPMSTGAPVRVISRQRLTLVLAFPFAVLLAASILSWPWAGLGLPGVVGALTPPGAVLLVGAVALSMQALRRGLPLGMLTWLPVGQGALVLLTTGFAAGVADASASIAVIGAYIVIYLICLGVAFVIAREGQALGYAYVALFILTQAARFPVFGEGAPVPVLLTLFALLRAAGELAVLVWLVRGIIEAPEGGMKPFAWGLVALALGHGVLAGWEDPLLGGMLTPAAYAEQVLRWLMLTSIQLGMITVLMRFRITSAMLEETDRERAAAEAARAAVAAREDAGDPAPPRRRRRRRR
ncbi:MAG: hypothetical protein VW450_07280 [Chloroflexota bacterium]